MLIHDYIGFRFPERELMTALSVLALRPLPMLKPEEVATWGVESLELLLSHFGQDQIHEPNNQSRDSVRILSQSGQPRDQGGVGKAKTTCATPTVPAT